MNKLVGTLVTAWTLALPGPRSRDERGGSGSGSTETILLLLGGIAIVAIVIGAITAYVNGKVAEIP